MRCGSTSTTRAAAPFIVAASGCAPPMPPRPAVTTRRPASVPPKWRRADGGERLVGALQNALACRCRSSCPAVIWPYIVRPRSSRSRNVSQVAQAGTSSELAMSTRGRAGVGAEHADRLARLHEQRLVVLERRAATRRWRRSTPSCAPPCPIRRRRPDRPGARRRRDRGCSSACAARLPAASPCRTAGAARRPDACGRCGSSDQTVGASEASPTREKCRR